MNLSFWGAARQVTGSMFLLETEAGTNILIDCGMNMGENTPIAPEIAENTPLKYGSFLPFEASQVHYVLLTHAHLDHSGYIPHLMREGFEGDILCTAPTYELTKILLEDSAAINRRRYKRLQKKRRVPEIQEQMKSIYFDKQVQDAMAQFVFVDFNKSINLNKSIKVKFIPTGHLLGAASIYLEIKEKDKTKKIIFSGDIGRFDYPLLPDPEPLPQADYIVCETTYGNRKHQCKGNAEDVLLEHLKHSFENEGRLIIPAFSIGRTQSLLYVLNRLSVKGKLPAFKVFSDSPMALESTKVYDKYRSWLNQEAKNFIEEHKTLFDFDNLIYLENNKQSKMVSKYPGPCVIISSSGMIQGGRIEHHVKANIGNPNSTILMIGYSAEGTMGHSLLHGVKTIQEKKQTVEVKANIESIDIFSGHGDFDDLMHFIKQQNTQELSKIFLVHGEYSSMQAFGKSLQEEGYQNIETPTKGEKFAL